MDYADIIERISRKPEEVQSIIRSLSKGAELIKELQARIDEAENEALLYYGAAVGL